jgi:imidazolonepropionase-like amidohydrolase
MNRTPRILSGVLATFTVTFIATAQTPPAPPAVTLFQNVRVYDGKSDKLTEPRHVLVRGNVIEKISPRPIPTDRRADTTLIDGGGRTLMPGLIDAHVHTIMGSITLEAGLTSDRGYVNLVAAKAAEKQLPRRSPTWSAPA